MKEITQAGNQLWHQVHERFTEQIRWRFNKQTLRQVREYVDEQVYRQAIGWVYTPIHQNLKR